MKRKLCSLTILLFCMTLTAAANSIESHTVIELLMKSYSYYDKDNFELSACITQSINKLICKISFEIQLGSDPSHVPLSSTNPVKENVSYAWQNDAGIEIHIYKSNGRKINFNVVNLDPESIVKVRGPDDPYDIITITKHSFSITYGLRVYCQPNYFGSNCSIHCEPNERYNCSKNGEKICLEGWREPSRNCELIHSICDRNPNLCFNGGSCKPGVNPNDFQCECDPQYTGEHCEYDHPCSDNPCQNGGSCRLVEVEKGHPPKHQCECLNGFDGVNCSEQITTKGFTEKVITTTPLEENDFTTSDRDDDHTENIITSDLFTEPTSDRSTERAHKKTTRNEFDYSDTMSTTVPYQTTERNKMDETTAAGKTTTLHSLTTSSLELPTETTTDKTTNSHSLTTSRLELPTGHSLIFSRKLNETELKLVKKVLHQIFEDGVQKIVINIHPEIRITIRLIEVTKITVSVTIGNSQLSNNTVYTTIFNRGSDWLNENMPVALYTGELLIDNKPVEPYQPPKMKVVPIILGVTFAVIGFVIVIIIIQLFGHRNKRRRIQNRVGVNGGSINDTSVKYETRQGRMSFSNPIYSSQNIDNIYV